jgi:hypothetical protein
MSTQAKLWEVRNQWSWEWENRYSDWFEVAFSEENFDFFEKHDMATDCADAAIAARWIFARKHGLPVLQHSATMHITDEKGNRVREMYSQDTMKRFWINQGLKADLTKPWHEDKLFVTALNYVLDNTNTYSLAWDSYPVEISQRSMLIGTHHLTFYPKGAHANILFNLEYFRAKRFQKEYETVAINMLNSTLPKAVRKLFKRHYARGERPSRRGYEGFLRMRWPVSIGGGKYELMERQLHPYWSEEQYDELFTYGYGGFYQAVTARLWSKYSFNYADLELLIKFINLELGERINTVISGYNLCVDDPNISHDDDKIEDCSPGTRNYDKYSTNNRDDRFQALMTAANRTFNMYKDDRIYKRRINSFLNGKVKLSGTKEANYHMVEFKHIIDAFTLPYYMTVKERREAEFNFSSDPRDSFYVRWGVEDLF